MGNSLDLKDFRITSVSGKIPQTVVTEAAVPGVEALPPSPLGLLAPLAGTWKGPGFNQIWRPFHGSQDRFLELNETTEELQFVEIPGDIPNRGFLQADMNLHGLTYLQKVTDATLHAGIHIEPGIWVNIPLTTNPADPATVARLATIPHGTSLVAQGTALRVAGPPIFTPVSIKPFPIGGGAPINFPEQNLATPSAFRTVHADIPHVTQAMVDNPNVVLAAGIAGKTITSTTVIKISTKVPPGPPTTGGGTSNIAFLKGAAGGPNADAIQMDAIFWIEEFKDSSGVKHTQLQYTQTVLLNFNTLSWPHVSVATLLKQP